MGVGVYGGGGWGEAEVSAGGCSQTQVSEVGRLPPSPPPPLPLASLSRCTCIVNSISAS